MSALEWRGDLNPNPDLRNPTDLIAHTERGVYRIHQADDGQFTVSGFPRFLKPETYSTLKKAKAAAQKAEDDE